MGIIPLLLPAMIFLVGILTLNVDGALPPADIELLMKMTDQRGARFQKAAQRPGEPLNTWECEHITAVPDNVRLEMNLSQFYQKYLHAFGVPILSSDRAKDAALRRACYVVVFTLADRKDIRRMFFKNHGRAAVISITEHVTTIPEHSWLPSWWNQRARGLGGTMQNPISTCGEENILCESNDAWTREDIFLHEFVHGLHNVGVTSVIQDFDSRLNARYRYLKKTKLKWDNTYYMSTDREYLAEGTQSFFEDNDEQIPPNGIHNFVNTRAELFSYDRQLYDFITEIFPCKNKLLIRCDAIKDGNGILMDFKTKKPVGGSGTLPPPTLPPPTLPPQTLPPATKPPTTQSPPPTTVPPGNCKDYYNTCSYWARTGACQKNPRYMLKYCRKSCKVCSAGGNCTDNNRYCSDWAYKGECRKNPNYMKLNCKKSCKLC